MRFAVLFTCLVGAGCGEGEAALPVVVEGTLSDGTTVRRVHLGGGGWAFEVPRSEASGGVIDRYKLYIEMSGARFDATASLELLPLDERKAVSRAVGFTDRLSFMVALPGTNHKAEAGGVWTTQQSATASIELGIGSERDAEEQSPTKVPGPVVFGSDLRWRLSIDEVTRPSDGAAGRLKGALELQYARVRESDSSLIGELQIKLDLPLVGEGFGRCQKALLTDPVGGGCPR
jgi:hypothetical protein